MADGTTTAKGIGILCGIFLCCTTLSIALRFYARYKQKAYLGADDWLIVFAWVIYLTLASLVYCGIRLGVIGYLQPKDKAILLQYHPTLEKIALSIDGLSVITLGVTKLSALFFFRRLFCSSGCRDTFWYVSLGFIAVVSAWIVVFFVLTWNLCGSHSVAWAIQPGHSSLCKLTYPYFEATAVSDFVLDFCVLALPLPWILRLHTDLRRKFEVLAVFLLALVGLAASLARMIITIHLVIHGRPIHEEDSYQANTQWTFFIMLEGGFTIVAVNLPTLWYFTKSVTAERVLRSFRSAISLHSRSSQPGGSYAASRQSVRKTSTGVPDLMDRSLRSGSTSERSGSSVVVGEDEASEEGRREYRMGKGGGGDVQVYAMHDVDLGGVERQRQRDPEQGTGFGIYLDR